MYFNTYIEYYKDWLHVIRMAYIYFNFIFFGVVCFLTGFTFSDNFNNYYYFYIYVIIRLIYNFIVYFLLITKNFLAVLFKKYYDNDLFIAYAKIKVNDIIKLNINPENDPDKIIIDCSICLELSNKKLIKLLDCDHVFHDF